MSGSPSTPSRPGGFSLLETLVGVGILLVLGGLSVAAYHGANSSVASTRTLSQLREIGVAAAGWSNDNGGQFPPSWDNTEGRNRSYAQALDPYLHGEDGYRNADSKFIGYNKRLKLVITPYSHPITFSLNRSLCKDVTQYGSYREQLVSRHEVENPAGIILAIDGCQNPRNLNQANASTYAVHHMVGEQGPLARAAEPIPVGPDTDTPDADGWIRYPNGEAHALMADGSTRTFKKGSIRNGNLWRSVQD